MKAVSLEHIYKLFGPHQKEAYKMLKEGANRAEVINKL